MKNKSKQNNWQTLGSSTTPNSSTLYAQYWNTVKSGLINSALKAAARETGWPTIRATYKTGSRHTCNPPVMDTDDDTLVLVDRLPDKKFMKDNGWEFCGDQEYSSSFEAYRNGERNLILITNEATYIRRCAATELCKAMNLTDKTARIAIWEVVAGYTGYSDTSAPIPGEGGLL